MHLLPIAVDAIADLAHRNPRLAVRWHGGHASHVDIVQVRFGAPGGQTDGFETVGMTTELMAEHDLWVTVDRDTDTLTIAVGGKLDASTVQTFRDGVEIGMTGDPASGPLALDLSSLRYMSAVGLHALLEAARQLTSQRELFLIEAPPALDRLLSNRPATPLRVIDRDDPTHTPVVRPAPPSGPLVAMQAMPLHWADLPVHLEEGPAASMAG